MKSVNILGRIDRVDHQILVQMFRQRQLHQNSVNIRIPVQTVDHFQQLFLRRVCIQLVFNRFHADFQGLLSL